MTGQLTPDEQGVRELAEALADVLEERGLVTKPEAPGRVLNVADVAMLLGRSKHWVYEHATELGAFRFTSGPRGRIGFDREEIERWKRDRQSERRVQPPPRAARRRRRRTGATPVELIPYDPAPFRASGAI
jgi:predicted DNA-binding transcriptional regulator AlpA